MILRYSMRQRARASLEGRTDSALHWIYVVRRQWRTGVRCEDFQTGALCEREERVGGAAAGMDCGKGGAHAGDLFDQIDAAIEIVGAENDVIEQSGHLIVLFRALSPREEWRGQRAAG